jgi:drug/metabolite transporter (DMT)-like permease
MEKENKKVFNAFLLCFVACLIWASNNIVARGIIDFIDPVSIAFWRFIIAIIVLTPFILKNFKKNFAILKKNPGIIIWMGFTAITLKNILYYTSAHFTEANNIALLGTSSLIWTATIGYLSGLETLTKGKIFGVFCAFAGALTIIFKGDFSELLNVKFNTGDILVVVAEFIWGIYTILLKLKPKDMDQTFMFAAMIFFGLLGLLPLYLTKVYLTGFEEVTTKALYVYLYVGVFASVISWVSFNYSVFAVGPVRTSIMCSLIPVMSAVMGYFALGEHIRSYHIVGFVLSFSGIVISNIKGRNEK